MDEETARKMISNAIPRLMLTAVYLTVCSHILEDDMSSHSLSIAGGHAVERREDGPAVQVVVGVRLVQHQRDVRGVLLEVEFDRERQDARAVFSLEPHRRAGELERPPGSAVIKTQILIAWI